MVLSVVTGESRLIENICQAFFKGLNRLEKSGDLLEKGQIEVCSSGRKRGTARKHEEDDCEIVSVLQAARESQFSWGCLSFWQEGGRLRTRRLTDPPAPP